jgi:hypothetical protein
MLQTTWVKEKTPLKKAKTWGIWEARLAGLWVRFSLRLGVGCGRCCALSDRRHPIGHDQNQPRSPDRRLGAKEARAIK